MQKYEPMWEKLGLNLEGHSGLLSVLSNAYKDIYLSQKNRPKAMGYFDFVISEVHGLRIEELLKAKADGKKVIGSFCVYVPEEIILAAGGVSVGLCAGADAGGAEADKYLPRNTCALIRAFMGFKLAGLCPYIEATDLVVGENTCDGKKKAYEVFADITGKVYIIDLPNMKSEQGKKLWLGEVKKFKDKIEELTGKKISLDDLKKGITLVNAKRKALQRLSRLRAADPAPISGLDALLVNQVSFYDDPVRFTEMTNQLCSELEERIGKGIGVAPRGASRILVSGSPMAVPNWKLHFIVEGCGAVVVGEESCVGERNFRDLVDEGGSDEQGVLERIAEKYLKVDCACFTPNDERIDHIRQLAQDLHADGIVHYGLQFCTPYIMEAFKIEKRISELPFLRIETDYSMEDAGQLRNRIEAFIEILGGRNR